MSDRPEFVQEVVRESAVPVLLATSDVKLASAMKSRVRSTIPATSPSTGSVSDLLLARDVILAASLDGAVKPGDRVVVVAANSDALDGVLLFDVDRDLELSHLHKELDGRADPKVVERVLRLANELAREGREGKAVGALFVVGDADHVLDHSRQAVINPFQGHPEKERNILLDSVTETVKEFALIDGGFVIDANGTIVAAGRYMDVDKGVPLQPGLGGRHLAAASISKATKAVAVAVSTAGSIRVFKDGRVVLLLGKT
jgi:DNA integrity scanning protein DisA with diadenylate cyclase activity